jgi:hypothetical protein
MKNSAMNCQRKLFFRQEEGIFQRLNVGLSQIMLCKKFKKLPSLESFALSRVLIAGKLTLLLTEV